MGIDGSAHQSPFRLTVLHDVLAAAAGASVIVMVPHASVVIKAAVISSRLEVFMMCILASVPRVPSYAAGAA